MFTVEDKSPKKIQNYSVPTKKIVSTKDPKISQRHMSYYNNNNHVRKPRLVQEHEVNIVLNKLDQQFLKFFIFLVVVFVHQVNLCVYFKNTNKKTQFWAVPGVVITAQLMVSTLIMVMYREQTHKSINKSEKRKKSFLTILRNIEVFLIGYSVCTFIFFDDDSVKQLVLLFSLSLWKIIVNVNFGVVEQVFLVSPDILIFTCGSYPFCVILFQVCAIDFMIVCECIQQLKCDNNDHTEKEWQHKQSNDGKMYEIDDKNLNPDMGNNERGNNINLVKNQQINIVENKHINFIQKKNSENFQRESFEPDQKIEILEQKQLQLKEAYMDDYGKIDGTKTLQNEERKTSTISFSEEVNVIRLRNPERVNSTEMIENEGDYEDPKQAIYDTIEKGHEVDHDGVDEKIQRNTGDIICNMLEINPEKNHPEGFDTLASSKVIEDLKKFEKNDTFQDSQHSFNKSNCESKKDSEVKKEDNLYKYSFESNQSVKDFTPRTPTFMPSKQTVEEKRLMIYQNSDRNIVKTDEFKQTEETPNPVLTPPNNLYSLANSDQHAFEHQSESKNTESKYPESKYPESKILTKSNVENTVYNTINECNSPPVTNSNHFHNTVTNSNHFHNSGTQNSNTQLTDSLKNMSDNGNLFHDIILNKISDIVVLFDSNCEIQTSNLHNLKDNSKNNTPIKRILNKDYFQNHNFGLNLSRQQGDNKSVRNLKSVFNTENKIPLTTNYPTMQILRTIYKIVKKTSKKKKNVFELPLFQASFRQIRSEAKKGLISISSMNDSNLRNSENNSYKTNMNEKGEKHIYLKGEVDFAELIEQLRSFYKQYDRSKLDTWYSNQINLNKSQSFGFSYNTLFLEVCLTGFSNEPMQLFIMSDMKEKISIVNYKEKNRFKTELLHSISHEQRTPLNYCVPTLEFICERFTDLAFNICDNYNIPNEAKTEMDEIYFDLINSWNNLKHMNLLLYGIVDFCSIEVKNINMTPVLVNIEEAISANLEIYQLIVDEKDVLVRVSIDEKAKTNDKLIWSTDQNRFNVIFTMIYHNSIKFTQKGGITICVGLEKPDILRISIIDTGIGIDATQLIGLKNTFKNRLSSFKTENSSGIGLGLRVSSCQQKYLGAKDYNKIEIISEKNHGTTIIFYLKFLGESNAIISKEENDNSSCCSYSENIEGKNVDSLLEIYNDVLQGKSSSLREFQKVKRSKYNSGKDSAGNTQTDMNVAKNYSCNGHNINEAIGSKESSQHNTYSNVMYSKPPTHGKEHHSRKNSPKSNRNSQKKESLENKIKANNKSPSIASSLGNSKEPSIWDNSSNVRARSSDYKSASDLSGSSGNKDSAEQKKSSQDQRNEVLNQKYSDGLLYNIDEEEYDNMPNLSSRMEFYGPGGISKKIDYLGKVSKAISFSPLLKNYIDNNHYEYRSNHDDTSKDDEQCKRAQSLGHSKIKSEERAKSLGHCKIKSFDERSPKNAKQLNVSPKVSDGENKQNPPNLGFSIDLNHSNKFINSQKSIEMNNQIITDNCKNTTNALVSKNSLNENENEKNGMNNSNLPKFRARALYTDKSGKASLTRGGGRGLALSRKRASYNLGIIKEERNSMLEDSVIKNLESKRSVNFGNISTSQIGKQQKNEQICLDEVEQGAELDGSSLVFADPNKLGNCKNTCQCNNVQIVDDEVMNYMAVKTMLKDNNLSFDFAYDGLKAYNTVNDMINNCAFCSYYKAIVMDFNMPVMDGIESAKKILELLREKREKVDHWNDKQDILIIGFSAYTDESTVNDALRAGMIKVLSKPTSRDIMVMNFRELGLI